MEPCECEFIIVDEDKDATRQCKRAAGTHKYRIVGEIATARMKLCWDHVTELRLEKPHWKFIELWR